MHRLRRQAQVGAHRNAALDQKAHRLGGPAAAFELDHVGARTQQHRRAAQRLFFGLVVAAKRQVTDHPGCALHPAQAAHHTFGVVGHGVQRHAGGAGQALAHHAQRVAHQNAFHPGGVGHGGKGRVVGGQHGDFFAALSHFGQAGQAHRLALGQGRRGGQGAIGCAIGGGAHGCAHGCLRCRHQPAKWGGL